MQAVRRQIHGKVNIKLSNGQKASKLQIIEKWIVEVIKLLKCTPISSILTIT